MTINLLAAIVTLLVTVIAMYSNRVRSINAAMALAARRAEVERAQWDSLEY